MSEEYNPNIKTPEELELDFAANFREDYNDINSSVNICSYNESETGYEILTERKENEQLLSGTNRIVIASMELQ